jgi:hypothetical protein
VRSTGRFAYDDVHQLCRRLLTLRRLPPGTRLPEPGGRELQELLGDLLGLSEEVDPWGWIRAERHEFAARVWLRHQLLSLKEMAVGVRQAKQAGWSLLAGQEEFLGDLLQLPDDAGPFRLLEQDATGSPEVLLRVLRQLQSVRLDATRSQAPLAGPGAREQWLVDLLRLPSDRDPLGWIQEQHGERAARTLLWHALEQYRLASTPAVGRVLHAQGPMRPIEVGEHLRVVVELLVFGAESFSLEADVRLFPAGVPRPAGVDHVLLSWSGFDQVEDDQGYHYLLKYHRISSGTGDGQPTDERLRLAFYPAIASGSAELVGHLA